MRAEDFPPDLMVALVSEDGREIGLGWNHRFYAVARLASPIPIQEWTAILQEEWDAAESSSLQAAIDRAGTLYGLDEVFVPPRDETDSEYTLLASSKEE